MAGWSGSGVFTSPYSWVADAAAGIDILATRMDAQFDNITSAGFGNTLTRDGQGSATANQPMNGHRHTNAGPAIDPGDYVTLGQLNGGSISQFVTAGGYQALGTDAGGFQFRAVTTTHGVGLRSDDTNAYLLDSATPTGTFSAHRPFAWNLATGAVAIDGTGAGCLIDGSQAIRLADFPSNIASPGSLGIPGGFIIKMGSCVTTLTGIAVTFDTAFDHGCLSISLGSLNSNPIFATYQSVSASGFFCQTWNAAASGAQVGGATVTYIAIGY